MLYSGPYFFLDLNRGNSLPAARKPRTCIPVNVSRQQVETAGITGRMAIMASAVLPGQDETGGQAVLTRLLTDQSICDRLLAEHVRGNEVVMVTRNPDAATVAALNLLTDCLRHNHWFVGLISGSTDDLNARTVYAGMMDAYRQIADGRSPHLPTIQQLVRWYQRGAELTSDKVGLTLDDVVGALDVCLYDLRPERPLPELPFEEAIRHAALHRGHGPLILHAQRQAVRDAQG